MSKDIKKRKNKSKFSLNSNLRKSSSNSRDNGNNKGNDYGNFPNFTINCNHVQTAIILLGSIQNDIILKSLEHLNKYAHEQEKNLEILHDLNLIKTIIQYKLHERDDLEIKRLTLKLLTLMFKKYENHNFTEDIINEIAEITKYNYMHDNDPVVIEYSSQILVSILNEPRICTQFENDVEFMSLGICRKLSENKSINTNSKQSLVPSSSSSISYSPTLSSSSQTSFNILYNSYKIFLKIIKCALHVVKICDIGQKPFSKILNDISNESEEIRNITLQIFNELLLCKNELFESTFICENFFNEIFKVLENESMVNSHPIIFELLTNLMKNENIMKLFVSEGYIEKYASYLKNQNDNQLKMAGLNVLVECANYSNNLNLLYDIGFIDMLLKLIDNVEDLNSNIIIGINRMLYQPNAFVKIIENDNSYKIITNLISIMDDGTKPFKIREDAANTLQILCKKHRKSSENTVKNDIGLIIGDYLRQELNELSINFLIEIISILNVLSKYQELRSEIMSVDLAKSLHLALKNSSKISILRANLFNIATAYIFEEPLQNEFLNEAEDFRKIIVKALKCPAKIVKNAVLDFIIVSGKMGKFSNFYIENGILECLIEDENLLLSCTNWSQAIETIFSKNLSIKFAVRGRLELNDLIGNGFFVSKHHWKDFRILKTLITEKLCPLYPVIFVSFDNTTCSSSSLLHIKTDLIDWTVCLKPSDKYLPKYLTELYDTLEEKGLLKISENSNLIDISRIENTAKVLANFVCRSMCGTYEGKQNSVCSENAIRNHLNILKCELHNNVIPIGHIRFGGHFERAILFKTLADQIGLPCTLVRSVDGRILYNELSIPVQEKRNNCVIKNLPKRLLVVTHIIDLMDYPGELYPLKSRQALNYLQLV